MRTGIGYDLHILKKGKKLVLGGVEIDFEKGLSGHSDADAAVHAVCDALLGAAGLGDIGSHFPNTDEKYKGISSIVLLKEIKEKLKNNNYEVNNIDLTIICEKPALAPHIEKMCKSIARAMDIPERDVNVKATTNEGAGQEGRMEAVSVMAVATIIPTAGYKK